MSTVQGPRLDPDHPAWLTAQLDTLEVDPTPDGSFSPTKFQRFSWRREPALGRVLRFALLSIVILPLGPVAWTLAHRELAAVEAGRVSRRGRAVLVVARLCAIGSTAMLVALAIAAIVAVL